ncbi:MAG: flagellar hook-basal body complex protein FliE [bacterium]|nr:flagellar hook-basal body complex protein FliE [bacterium]
MTVQPLVPDAPLPAAVPLARPLGAPLEPAAHEDDFARALASAVDGVAGSLRHADGAERAMVAGRGSIQAAAIARAQADAAVAVAAAVVDHVARALSSISQMQV